MDSQQALSSVDIQTASKMHLQKRRLSLLVIGFVLVNLVLVGSLVFISQRRKTVAPERTRAAEAVNLYVSPFGNDSNGGTEQAPFQSLKTAQIAARVANDGNRDVDVYLRGGTYALSGPWEFDSLDSGKNGRMVTFKSYPGEIPIISGGKKITGWTQTGNFWKANVGTGIKSRQLYVNGNRAIRARSAGGFANAMETSKGLTTTDMFIGSFKNLKDIELVYNAEWKQPRCSIDSVSGQNIYVQLPCFANINKHGKGVSEATVPAWYENALDLLDSPGEWYLDQTEGSIYYWPRNGEDMLTSDVEMPVLETLLWLKGTPDSPVENVGFEGLTFSYATWLEPSTNEGFAQITQDYRLTGNQSIVVPYLMTPTPGNVKFDFVRNSILKKNTFRHLGATGLFINGGSKNNQVIGNHFTDISATGIHLGDIEYYAPDSDVKFQTLSNVISNNYIHKIGQEFQGSPGLFMAYAAGTTISNNLLEDLPYNGIHLGYGWGEVGSTYDKNHTILSNRIYDYMQAMEDGGGIHSITDMPGSLYKNNLISSAKNKVSGGAVYLDQGSGGIEVTGNVLFNNFKNFFYNKAHVESLNIHDNYESARGSAVPIMSTAGLTSEFRLIRGDVTSVTTSGNKVFVNFVNESDKADWIGIYNPGAGDTQFLQWKYLDNQNKTAPTNQPSSGTVTFDVPDGTYEVRYIHQGTAYAGVKTAGKTIQLPEPSPTPTPTFAEVPPPEPKPTSTPTPGLGPTNPLITSQTNGIVSASYYSATPDTGDWIGIFTPTSYNNTPLDWRWLTNSQGTKPPSVSSEGTVTFKQLSAGTYEVRYIKAGTGSSAYKTAGVSIIVTTATPTSTPTPIPKLTLSQSGGVVSASYNEPTAATGDWIGIFYPSSYNNQPLDWRWLNNTTQTKPTSVQTTGNVSFGPLPSGTYEVRFIKQGTGSSAYKTGGVKISW